MSDPIRTACVQVIRTLSIPEHNDERYEGDRTSLANLRWMQARLMIEAGTMPIDKMNRWIGFIQGVLTVKGYLDADAERDRTRPIFHEAYAAAGLAIPQTMDRETNPIIG